MPQIGIAGNCQNVYGSQVWANWFALGPEARNLKTWWNYEEWLGGYNYVSHIWSRSCQGTGDAFAYQGTAARPGTMLQAVGAVNDVAGYYAGGLTLEGIMFSGGIYTIETELNIVALSTAAQEFVYMFGFGDTMGADQVDGAYFRYDRAANVNWLCNTANNSARTSTDSGVAVLGNTWTKLKIVVNAAGTAADFYINGILVATNVLNIPTARATGMLHTMIKTVGATQRSVTVDWTWVHIDLTTSR